MGIFDRLFGAKKPAARKRYNASGEGHRGIGIGESKHTSPSPVVLDSGRILNRQSVGSDEVYEFLMEGAPLFVHSSNVAMAQYYPEDEKLQIEFLNGSAYLYSPVSMELAQKFAEAHSKGIWVWSNLRVRGEDGDHKPAPGITVERIK
jgi:hypothetical protein